MLGITSLFLLAIQVFNLDLTITTGFSAKNLVVYLVAVGLGEPASISLALLSFLCGAAFILLAQEGPI